MEQTSSIIASTVVAAVDGVTWDWDDVAAAAAALGCISHPFVQSIATHLWLLLEDEVLAHGDVPPPIPCSISGKIRDRLRAVCRAAGIKNASKDTYRDLHDRLVAHGDRPIGKSCVLSTRAARQIATRLAPRCVTWTTASRFLKLQRGQLEAAGCRAIGAPHGGTYFVLRDVRALLRRKHLTSQATQQAIEQLRSKFASTVSDTCHARKRQARIEKLREIVRANGWNERAVSLPEAKAFIDGTGALDAASAAMGAFAAFVQQHAFSAEDVAAVREVDLDDFGRMLRHKQLRSALATRGLVIRQDSEVCSRFVAAGGDVNEVVEIMDEMRFYFTETHYSQHLRWERGRHIYNDHVTTSAAAKAATLKARGWVPPTAPARVLQLAATLGVPVQSRPSGGAQEGSGRPPPSRRKRLRLSCDLCGSEDNVLVSVHFREALCESCIENDEELSCHKWEDP